MVLLFGVFGGNGGTDAYVLYSNSLPLASPCPVPPYKVKDPKNRFGGFVCFEKGSLYVAQATSDS